MRDEASLASSPLSISRTFAGSSLILTMTKTRKGAQKVVKEEDKWYLKELKVEEADKIKGSFKGAKGKCRIQERKNTDKLKATKAWGEAIKTRRRRNRLSFA